MARTQTTTDAQAPKSARKSTSRKARARKTTSPQAVEHTVFDLSPEEAAAEKVGEVLSQAMADTEPDPEEGPAKIERSWPNTDGLEIECPACGKVWEPKVLRLSIQCPGCGAWVKVRIKADLKRYVRGLGVTPSGHDTLDIGDGTADTLRGLTVDEILETTAAEMAQIGVKHASKALRKAIGAWDVDSIQAYLADRYASRNNGMVRMNCGNLLRAMRNRAAAA